MRRVDLGKPDDVPLFRCADCGFVTTASQTNALAAHEAGSPDCAGEIQLIADFTRAPMVAAPGARRRRRGGAAALGQTRDVLGQTHDAPAGGRDLDAGGIGA